MTERTPDRLRRPAAVRAGAGLAQNKRPGRAGRANKRRGVSGCGRKKKRLTGSLGDGLFRHRQRGTKGRAGKAAEGPKRLQESLGFPAFLPCFFLAALRHKGFCKAKAGSCRRDKRRSEAIFPLFSCKSLKKPFFSTRNIDKCS